MGPPKAVRTISREAFDEMVKENMDDLGMDPTEALEDAVETVTLQDVNLSGIVTCVPGHGSVQDNPVIQCLDRLKQLSSGSEGQIGDSDYDELAGSDANKNTIVEKGGMDRLIKLSDRFSDDPSVFQEVISIICVPSLRTPENAACAVEAGAADFAIHAMQKFPASQLLQKNSCLMIRNLVVRNPENK